MKPPATAFLADIAPKPACAVFGKHPLAADHLEDVGLSTPSLVAFKQGLYIGGIGECLSRQSWLKDLAGGLESIPYDHHLLCIGQSGWLMARLLHSSDAAGRRQYPLVLALHSGDFPLLHQIGGVAAAMEETLETLRSATSLDVLRQTPAALAQRLSSLLENAQPSPGSEARESWLQHMPGAAPDREWLWRCCHALMPEGAAAGRARVPIHPGAPWPSAALWASFIASLGVSVPMSLVWRNHQDVMDVWLSPPGARVLAGLFADASSQPPTTQVPFNIPAPIREKADASLKTWLNQPALFPSPQEKPAEVGLLNKVCHNVLGWFKPHSPK